MVKKTTSTRGRSGKKKPEPEETSVPESTLVFPASTLVKDLAKKRKSAKNKQSEIAGEIGSAIGKASDEKHLDRKAFGLACSLYNMEDERLAISLPHLLQYIKDLGLYDRIKDFEPMFAENEMGGDKAEAPRGSGKVVSIGSAARQVAEAAGAEQ